MNTSREVQSESREHLRRRVAVEALRLMFEAREMAFQAMCKYMLVFPCKRTLPRNVRRSGIV